MQDMVWARASSRDSSPGNVLMLSVRPSITTSCTYRPRTRDAWGMAWLSAFSRDKISNKISSAGLTSWPTKKFAMDDTTFSEMRTQFLGQSRESFRVHHLAGKYIPCSQNNILPVANLGSSYHQPLCRSRRSMIHMTKRLKPCTWGS